jgi:hypothetical protein
MVAGPVRPETDRVHPAPHFSGKGLAMQGKSWRYRAGRPARAAMALAAACTLAAAGAAASAPPAAAAQRPRVAVTTTNMYNTNAGKCLGNNAKRFAFLWHCVDSHKPGSNQTWHLGHDNPHNSYYAQLINGQGRCLGVLNHSKKNGATVVVGKCQGPRDKTQYWVYDTTWLACGCGYGPEFANFASPAAGTGAGSPHGTPGTLGMVLGVRDNAKGNGARVVLQKNTVGIGIRNYDVGQAWYASFGGGT